MVGMIRECELLRHLKKGEPCANVPALRSDSLRLRVLIDNGASAIPRPP